MLIRCNTKILNSEIINKGVDYFLGYVLQDKIKKVHLAARDGNLRDLQAALDRRKFATARDKASPYGGTPLHVATIFGHAGQ